MLSGVGEDARMEVEPLVNSESDRSELLRELVGGHVREHHPELSEEFRVSFDATFEAIRIKSETEQPEEIDPDSGVGFDSGLVAGTLISVACWVGVSLLQAAFRDSVERDLIPRLDAAEKKLAEWTGRPELVRALRERLEWILEKL